MLVLVVTLLAATAVGLLWTWRTGRMTSRSPGPADTGAPDLLRELGVEGGDRATLVQFSSAFCAPCRATRTLLAHIAEQTPGVVHVEVDAEQRLDLVRRLGILKTPTTLVLDGRRREIGRAAGVPRQSQVLAALPS